MSHPPPTNAFPQACRVAIILSCFNRRQKTLEAIRCVLAQSALTHTVLDFFITDDNSHDGTAEALLHLHPGIHLLKGNGSLFWNGGMRLAWSEALKGDYDFYLWLNDDTFLFPHTLQRLLDTHARCMARHGQAGIVVGSTCDDHGRTSYGGERQTSRLRPLRLTTIPASVAVQSCDTFNGNCVLVSKHAADVLGNLDRDAERNDASLHRAQQALLTFLDQPCNAAHIFECETRLSSDSGQAVTAFAHAANILQEVDRAVLAPRAVLDQAGDEAVFCVCRDDEGGHLLLTERLIGFQSTLSAHEVVEGTIGFDPACDRDWPLEADLGNAVHDLREPTLVARPRVHDCDPVERDPFDTLRRAGATHAACAQLRRAAIRWKAQRSSNR